MDTHSYKGWLNSDDQTKRIFGVWGHYMLAHWVIFCCLVIAFFTLAYAYSIGLLLYDYLPIYNPFI